MAEIKKASQWRCAIYTRVSSGLQEDNSSLSTQEARCRAYAEERGWMVTEVFREVHTGAELFERPQLTRLRETMRRREFDVLLVYALDRLSRKQTHQGLILSEAEYAGVEWDSVTEDIDHSPQGQILRAVIGGMAEMERLKIAERTVRGRMARAQAGKILPGRAPLYGYCWRDATKAAYDVDPVAGPIVRRIFNSVTEGKTLRSIAIDLTRDGFPTPSGNVKWSHSTIYTILKQPAYTAEGVAWRYGTKKLPGERGRVFVRPEAEHIKLPAGTIPELIESATFNAVQERLRHNQEQASRNNSAPMATLLRGGFIRCGYCGTALGVTKKKGLHYYRHGVRQRDQYGCPSVHIRTNPIDDTVWRRLESLLLDPQTIETEVRRLHDANSFQADLNVIDRQIAALSKKQTNLVKRLALLDDDTATLVTAELATLASHKVELQEERDAIVLRQSKWERLEDQLNSFEAFRHRVATNLSDLAYEQRRQLLEALGIGVLLYHSNHTPRYEIRASLPIDEAIVSIPS
jgi:site-specific DNA recombinase